MKKQRRFRVFVVASLYAALAVFVGGMAFAQQTAPQPFGGMRWRMIGPFRGGRALAAVGVPGKPHEYYFGAVGGGVWKSTNGGETWQPIFDSEPIASIGTIAVAPSDPKTIYVGTGEADMRSDISFGDGMYKSTDGGATWKKIGLDDSRHIGRILVDPKDPNVVLVAALGHAYGPSSERGVYRSTDGGATWAKVLGKNEDTGAIDLASDPANPRVVYAALWQVRRPPWSAYAPASGPGSGLYKSADGGVTWKELSGHGFPSEGLGRIGIAVTPGGNGGRVYAIVDAREGGLYRSDDAGETWRRISADHRIWGRGWYFGRVTVDPRDAAIVYICNTAMYRSTDGGKTFIAIKGAPGGDDYHSLWIAPDDPDRMILASDQGVAVSVDGAKTWGSWYNQPTAQFYHVITDNAFPYRVYGSQQDSGTVAVLSRSDYGQITFRDWMPVGGEESGYIVPDPNEPTVYGGGPFGMLRRFDWATGQSFNISPWPSLGPGNQFRYTWTSPLVISPKNPRFLYFGAQFVLRTSDRGASWEKVSPDLTVREPTANASSDATSSKKQPDRGVVYTIAPSPVQAGEIWAGTDNGLIQLTTDEGKTWSNVTPPGVSDWSMVSLIEASRFDAATAYAAIHRYQVDDFHPYVFRTLDAGKTWQKIVASLPENIYVHAVREDPVRKGLLFAGTETGVFVSFDDGDHWQPLQLNLPAASVRDLAIHGNDLVAATHGRSFWILDDISPLREWSDRTAANDAHLFRPAAALRIRRSENNDTPLPRETPVGENPPAGAVIYYHLKSDAAGAVALEIRDSKGQLVQRFSSDDRAAPPSESPAFPSAWLPKREALSRAAGMHRFIWDLRYPRPSPLHDEYSIAAIIKSGAVPELQGPLALPGEYEVSLLAGGQAYKQTLKIEMDPRVRVAADELQKQFELEQQIDTKLDEATRTYREITDLRRKLRALNERLAAGPAASDLLPAVNELDGRLESITGKASEDWPFLSAGLRQLDGSLASLAIAVDSADSAPTAQAMAAFAEYGMRLDDNLVKWKALQQQELPALNRRLQQAGLSVIVGDESGKRAAN